MNTQHFFYDAVSAVLRITLVLALVASVWNIYRHLPDDSNEQTRNGSNAVVETELRIVMREPTDHLRAALNLPVELYPIDMTAVQKEFFSERRPGKRLEDFTAERMGDRAPIETRFDKNGEVTVRVKPGPWWIHATLPGEPNIVWRLRVSVSGLKQTVELSPDNAYTRTRSF